MHTPLFKMFLLLCVLAIGALFLFSSGLLPQGVYALTYEVWDNTPFASASTEPYLEKYEGHWALTFKPTTISSPYGDCPALTVILAAHDASLAGHGAVSRYLFTMEANINHQGELSGTFSTANQEYTGTFSGGIAAQSGYGSWQDNLGCSGTWILSKLGSVIDPVQAIVTSLSGSPELERSGTSQALWLNMNLYAGDTVTVPADSTAIIALGPSLTPMNIPAGSTYAVPNAGEVPASSRQAQ